MRKNGLIVKDIDFYGDTLKAAKDSKGMVWVGILWLCKGMGLTKDQIRNERKRIQDDLVLSEGVKFHPLGTGNTNKNVLCLQLDYVPLWLAKISITPNMKENNPELVKKLVKYQLKAKDVLAAAFIPKSPYWQQTRTECKSNRRLETEEIRNFIEYAKGQGSQNAERYYINFTSLANNAIGISSNGRNETTVNQLNSLTLIEHIIKEVIREGIRKEKYYKDIYTDCKKRIRQFKEISFLTSKENT